MLTSIIIQPAALSLSKLVRGRGREKMFIEYLLCAGSFVYIISLNIHKNPSKRALLFLLQMRK